MPTWCQRQAGQQVRTYVARAWVGWVVCVSSFVLNTAPAAGQEPPPDRQVRPGRHGGTDALGSEPKPTTQWRWGAFVGGARNSPVTPRLGQTPGRDPLFVGAQAQTTVLKVGGARLSYGVQVVPIVIIRGRTAPVGYSGIVDERGLVPGPETTRAWGLAPFAMEIAVPLGSRLAVYGAAAGGMIFFPRPYPVPEGKRSNFTIEYGGGVLLRVTSAGWLQAGYKYHHLSNAYRERVNPGLDAHVLHFGFWKALGK